MSEIIKLSRSTVEKYLIVRDVVYSIKISNKTAFVAIYFKYSGIIYVKMNLIIIEEYRSPTLYLLKIVLMLFLSNIKMNVGEVIFKE